MADMIRERLTLIDPEDFESLLFFSRMGTPFTPYNVRRTFRGILRAAGLEGVNISPHSFRRTAAMLLANELGMQAEADVLGHTLTSTTNAHYAEPDRTVKPEPAAVLQKHAPPKWLAAPAYDRTWWEIVWIGTTGCSWPITGTRE